MEPPEGAGRGAALRDSMRKVLQSKAQTAKGGGSPSAALRSTPGPAAQRSDESFLNSLDWDEPVIQAAKEPNHVAGGQGKSRERGVAGFPTGERTDAAAYNQSFFDEMEKAYTSLCADDGWEELRQEQEDLSSLALPRSEIPKDSDYFRVELPAGSDRELRCSLNPGDGDGLPLRSPGLGLRAAALQARPRRDLAALRRVEAAAREALAAREAAVREGSSNANATANAQGANAQGAAAPRSSSASDRVVVDSLSDSDSDSAGDVQAGTLRLQALETYAELRELERAGREQRERMARWRERWG